MDGLGSGLQGSFDDVVYLQVALTGRRRSYEDCFVGVFGKEGILVRFGVDGHSRYAQFPTGTHNPNGDLSPVGDQDLIEHPRVLGTARVKPFWNNFESN